MTTLVQLVLRLYQHCTPSVETIIPAHSMVLERLNLASFGESFTLDAQLFPMVEKFTCKLYGIEASNTDEARYKKFCLTKRTPEPQQLPPTRDALLCHCKRVSDVTAIVKSVLVATLSIPNLDVTDGRYAKVKLKWNGFGVL